MTSLAERVAALVERVYEGSVNRAAKDMDMPQSSLSQIVSGHIKSPRMATIKTIADFFDADLTWLITGRGVPPELLRDQPYEYMPHAEMLRWSNLVHKIAGGDGPLALALLRLPTAIFNASLSINSERVQSSKSKVGMSPAKWEEAVLKISQAERASFKAAWAYEHRAWISRVESWLDVLGVEKLRELLLRDLKLIELGYRRTPHTAPTLRTPASRSGAAIEKRRKK
jgi:transcriptional regulator with XRE-family HTH domain